MFLWKLAIYVSYLENICVLARGRKCQVELLEILLSIQINHNGVREVPGYPYNLCLCKIQLSLNKIHARRIEYRIGSRSQLKKTA